MNESDAIAGAAPKSLERAFRLLGAMIEDGGGSSIEQIALTLGLPSSTSFRMVRSMVRARLLVRAEAGRYHPSFRLLSAGGHAVRCRALGYAARPILRSFARQHGVIVHLGLMNGDMVDYVIKEGDPTNSLFTREGMQLEAYCSAIGKLLLSQLPEPELSAYLENGPFVALTPRTIISPDALRNHLAGIVSADLAIDDGEVAEDLACVAVPVRAVSGAVVAAVSCSRVVGTQASPGLETVLREVAAAIGDAL